MSSRFYENPYNSKMLTSMQPQFEEKRFALRMALRLPIVVSGRAEDGSAWSEPTETDDISTLGALFQLNQPIAPGETLYIRSHRPDGVPVEVKAKVVRLTAANYGTSRIGVAIVESKDNWLRLFVAWIADDNVVEGIEE
ncbi:MAG TPA: PilZ domain-containing protein [Pyrinomonadaceae bacterium]|nr:PilZ domain-containing protein [Pyrinomonadaceae bacterium]